MSATHLTSEDVEGLVSTRARIAVIGGTGSGVWDLRELHPRAVLLLEAEDLPHWEGDLLVLTHPYQPIPLVDWIARVDPRFDVRVLGRLEPKCAVLFTR